MVRSKSTFSLAVTVVGAALLAGGCTLKKQDTPPLTGPSELGTSISMSVTPDVLAQDGASQALVTITARDNNGQALRNLSLRAEIYVAGTPVDFGTLSARNVVTDTNGRTAVVYTAPSNGGSGVDTGTVVDIVVTPSGSDYGNAMERYARIRLVPPGMILPPDGLNPSFVFSPATPVEGDSVFFAACADPDAPPCDTAVNPITSFSWDFGDGDSDSGQTATHAYQLAGNYTVTLTASDAFGRARQRSKQLTVGPGLMPTASFTFSPNPSRLNQPLHFNASGSTAPAGRRIVSYKWDFGDGVLRTTSSANIDHTYTVLGTYIVSLTVTDDTGKVSAPSTQPVKPE